MRTGKLIVLATLALAGCSGYPSASNPQLTSCKTALKAEQRAFGYMLKWYQMGDDSLFQKAIAQKAVADSYTKACTK